MIAPVAPLKCVLCGRTIYEGEPVRRLSIGKPLCVVCYRDVYDDGPRSAPREEDR